MLRQICGRGRRTRRPETSNSLSGEFFLSRLPQNGGTFLPKLNDVLSLSFVRITPKRGSASFVFFRSARSCSLVVQPFTEGRNINHESASGIKTGTNALLDKPSNGILRDSRDNGCRGRCRKLNVAVVWCWDVHFVLPFIS